MSGLTVYGHGVSQPSRSLFLFCKVAKIPHTVKVVDLMSGEHKKEPYLSVNPRGAVPSIVDDDFKLTECYTILRYLAKKYKVADHWYPADVKTQARVNEYLDWQHTGLRKAGVDIMVGMVFTPMFSGKPIDEEKLKKDFEKFDEVLGTVEKFLGDKKFLAADEISIADICAMTELAQVLSVQRTHVLAKHPKLKAWKDRVQQRLNPAYDEVTKTLLDFVANTLKK